MITFDLQQICSSVQGTLKTKEGALRITGVSTDTRTLEPGDLFVPLRGENYDGHDYLMTAVERGAVACLSEEVVAALPVPVIQVSDTLKALGDLAAAVRQTFTGPVVAVTGSAGKTTTKELLASILEQRSPGLKTAGNFNNLVGLPLTLFNLEPEDQWMVLEMGTSARGEIARMAEIAKPDVGIITNVGAAHLQTLLTLEGVARAKGELFTALISGTAVVNADDRRVLGLPVANNVRRLLFGLCDGADVRASNVAVIEGCAAFELWADGEAVSVQLQVPGRHQILNALAAAAAAIALGVPMNDIGAGLEAYLPAAGRMVMLPMSRGGVLLDDSYNANPLSMEAALVALSDLGVSGSRIAVLGDMLELGEGTEDLHRELGRNAAGYVDRLIVLGQFGEAMMRGAIEGGMVAEEIFLADSHAQAGEKVCQWYQPHSGVLLKGSRGMKLEIVADTLAKAGLLTADEEH